MTFSNVPHTHANTVRRLHGDELGPLSVRAIRDLDDWFASSLLAMDSRNLTLGQIDMRSGTIGSQVSIVNRWDCEMLDRLR